MKTTIWLAVITLGIVWSCMIFYMLYWGKQIKNLANKYNKLSGAIEKIQYELSLHQPDGCFIVPYDAVYRAMNLFPSMSLKEAVTQLFDLLELSWDVEKQSIIKKKKASKKK